jgi:hypothetical protein
MFHAIMFTRQVEPRWEIQQTWFKIYAASCEIESYLLISALFMVQ